MSSRDRERPSGPAWDGQPTGDMSKLDEWDAYDRESSALAAHFLAGTFAGRPVYPDLEDDVLAALGEQLDVEGDPSEAFVEAVKPTIWLREPRPLFLAHAFRLQRWRRGD